MSETLTQIIFENYLDRIRFYSHAFQLKSVFFETCKQILLKSYSYQSFDYVRDTAFTIALFKIVSNHLQIELPTHFYNNCLLKEKFSPQDIVRFEEYILMAISTPQKIISSCSNKGVQTEPYYIIQTINFPKIRKTTPSNNELELPFAPEMEEFVLNFSDLEEPTLPEFDFS